jgi:hypothetical protein
MTIFVKCVIDDALVSIPRDANGVCSISDSLLDWVVANAALDPDTLNAIAALETGERDMFNVLLFDWLSRIEATD